jgi:hypothetical protein
MDKCRARAWLLTTAALGITLSGSPVLNAEEVELRRDDDHHCLSILVDGKELLGYRYDPGFFLPRFFPVLGPSGNNLTDDGPKDHPHQRSIWFCDQLKLDDGKNVDFYMGFYDKKKATRIRHKSFEYAKATRKEVLFKERLVWECAGKPLADETRTMSFFYLGDGEYLMDLVFRIEANHGKITFKPRDKHISIPFIRLAPDYTGNNGGTIENSEGGIGEKQTMGKTANWVDYSNTVNGKTEGIAVFSHPDSPFHPPKWFTRGYGLFGPRRVDQREGKTLSIEKGESLSHNIGILIHRGDVEGGKVSERYKRYTKRPEGDKNR